MKLSFVRLVLGPLGNNVYLLADEDPRDAVVIDPSFGSEAVLAEVKRQGWMLRQVWLTHGHYDHTTGAEMVSKAFDPHLPIGMHAEAEAWASTQKNGVKFGFPIQPVPQIDFHLEHGQMLSLNPDGGEPVVEVRLAPGHNPGSVILYCEQLGVAFCGDVIFRESIGRTDLPGGNYETLITSIREQVLTLPETTTLLPGHGPESSVGYERIYNPYLA